VVKFVRSLDNLDIIVTKSGVSIIGANSISTIFTGDIYFNMAVSSLFYSVGQLANISVYGCIYHANFHLFSNSLSISGIISAPPNGKSNVIMSGGAGIGGDCTITNNSILYANSDTIPIVLNQNGVFYSGWYAGNWQKKNSDMAKAYHLADYVFWQSDFCRKQEQG
jgi:hypothetical protein